MRPDYVLGIAPASLNLAGLVVPGEVGSALDLGTGCGVQALHLSRRAARVVGTDVNERALRLAALTAALNEVEVDLRAGSLYEPVAGERFDLIVSNPPFVVSPPGPDRLTYRETPWAGDAAVEHLVRQAPAYLTEGGWLQTLANWAHRRGEDWRDRVGDWLGDRSAWAVQREVLGCEEYAELWLRDAGLHGTPAYLERYDEWLRWFDGQSIEAIGMGWIALHPSRAGPSARSGRTRSSSRSVRTCASASPAPRRVRSTWTPSGWSPRPTWSRNGTASLARRTRRRSCCAGSAGCAGPSRSTPRWPVSSAPATAS